MTVVEKALLLGMASLAGASIFTWRRSDVAPALAYTRRCNLARSDDAYKASAVASWSEKPEKQPCPT